MMPVLLQPPVRLGKPAGDGPEHVLYYGGKVTKCGLRVGLGWVGRTSIDRVVLVPDHHCKRCIRVERARQS